jgi:hypothetical protein
MHRKTKKEVLINPRNGFKAVIRATITHREIVQVPTDDLDAGYHISGVYEFQDADKWVQFDTFTRYLTFEEVAALYEVLKNSLQAEGVINQFDELFGVGLHHVLATDGLWNLNYSDWE